MAAGTRRMMSTSRPMRRPGLPLRAIRSRF
jgi:hypothetical protein